MTKSELVELIRRKKSFLCVGLDSDPDKLPEGLKKDPDAVFKFNKAIIESTLPYAVSYKLNIAFYEAMGIEGWDILKRTIELMPPREALIIADAKRGDIGNTAARYGKAFFETLNCDAITLNPYMGEDSIIPFLEYEGKWSIVLGLTSNVGAKDIELLKLEDGSYVFEAAMTATAKLGSSEQIMFVVGATQSEYFERIRKVVPDHFLLIPGVGAQGGQLTDLKSLMTPETGILVNSSRQIIYASSGGDFAEASALEAEKLQIQMSEMMI
tara:strand:+ start:161 stop:967 length:807 start_codon:yes stop_codon:yes gene_type:complete